MEIRVQCDKGAHPSLGVKCARVHPRIYEKLGFNKMHYLGERYASSASWCYLFLIGDNPVAISLMMKPLHSDQSCIRSHRFVVHEDYQGLGLSMLCTEFIAMVMKGTFERDYSEHTSHSKRVMAYKRRPDRFIVSESISMYSGIESEGIDEAYKMKSKECVELIRNGRKKVNDAVHSFRDGYSIKYVGDKFIKLPYEWIAPFKELMNKYYILYGSFSKF